MIDHAFTVVIPAHNESSVIERCLKTLFDEAPANAPMAVIVAANGCTDDTAARAKLAAPSVTVIEQQEGSKTKAMNAARRQVADYPVIFLDADVQCSYSTLAALAAALREPGVMAASPAIKLDLSRSSSLVRAYYRVWLSLPYITDRMVGSGCFGMSQEACQTLGEFPPLIGDDIWVRSSVSYDQRRSVNQTAGGSPAFFLVSPPRTLRDQIRVEVRRRIGNRQIDALLNADATVENHRGSHGLKDLLNARSSGASWLDLAVYTGAKLGVVALAKLSSLKGEPTHWERDLAARET